jgi:DNA-binding LacI/PurR family transcriptional regulator
MGDRDMSTRETELSVLDAPPPGPRPRATLKQIASIARVNVSTVSRAINDSPLITKETKEMILAIAERMNYFPNSLARGLVSQKSETLGIVLPTIYFLQGPFFSQVLSGIEHVSVQNGYNILIASATGKARDKHFPFNLTRARRIDGMLIINEYQRIANLTALKKEGFPFVFVNRHFTEDDMPCVASDNVQGGRLGTEHLIALGHRRIGIVTGSLNLNSTHGRLEGYRAALLDAGIAYDEVLVQEGLFEKGIETGLQAGEKLLAQPNPPTAIFAFSDELAIGVMQAARNRGVRIPEDLAVIGYDNIEYSAHVNPPLTTIAQDPYAIGSNACQILIDLLNGKTPEKRNLLIPVQLIVRQSCGASRLGR